MASLSDKINAWTSTFTAIAALAAAASAYYSYEQTRVANINLLRTEQLAAFDKFTDSAILICDDFSFPKADDLWDFAKDDFKDRSTLDNLGSDKIFKDRKTETYDESAAKALYDKNNNNFYLAMKVMALQSSGVNTKPIDDFVREIGDIRQTLNNNRKHMDSVDGLANAIRADHTAEHQCRLAVGNLLVLYRSILHPE